MGGGKASVYFEFGPDGSIEVNVGIRNADVEQLNDPRDVPMMSDLAYLGSVFTMASFTLTALQGLAT